MLSRKYLDELSYKILGCAIEVHREIGPGLLESVYQKCLVHELFSNGLHCVEQLIIPIRYKNMELNADLRLDILVEDLVIVELKSVETLNPIFQAQLLTYMKLLQKPKAFLSILIASIFSRKDKEHW